ncbi:MAG TPA: choice-of-anchor L domain-containing protein, partial [Saprospiraceae bacterium]|nr:choice-of-anchor L domain-containing protein [Saprospiraceae bacterium]
MLRYLSCLLHICLASLLSGAFPPLAAQSLQVTGANTPPFTPDNLIRNVLLGEGVEVKSVTFNGKPLAVGYFTGGTASVGIERGVVMTTGSAKNAAGNGNQQKDTNNASTATDPDLGAVATTATYNVAVYEIAFVPTADTLRFRYCFASEEYPEFACQSFNDVFAFFIQGPGYPTPTNIARIPGTNEVVSINTLHPAYAPNFCLAAYDQYYNSNLNQSTQPIYDGFTDVFTAEAIVTPCQLYTIKLAIADVGDEIYDSGVFLEAKSFGTGSLKVALSTPSADASIAEGCAPAALTFSLPLPLKSDFPIDFALGGTATAGTDYQGFPSTLSIPAGQTSLSVSLQALADNLPEAGEYIALDVQRDPCNRDTLLIYIRDNALLPPALPTDTTYCVSGAQALILDGTLPLPAPQPSTFSNTDDFAVPDDDNQGVAIPIQVFGVQPTTLGPGVIRSVCLNASHPWIDDLDLYLISPGGQVLELSTDNGQNGMNYTGTCFLPTATKVISEPGPFAPASAAPFTGNWLPEGPWSDLWDAPHPANGTWKLQATDDQITLTGSIHDWSLSFEPSYKINYQWSPATGLDCATCPQVSAAPAQTTQYTLTASDSYGCSLSQQISISPQAELAAPTVTCGSETSNSLTFNWNAVSGANAYEVNVNGSGWVPANGSQAHTVSPVQPGATLQVQVRGLSSGASCLALIGAASCTKCVGPGLQVQPTPPGCAGSSTGKISVSVPNPLNPPYTYSLGSQSNGSGLFEGLSSGTYTVTVTDAKGCSSTQSVGISPAPPFSASATALSPAPCFGMPGGSALAAASGGTAPYTYGWSSGDISSQATSLTGGLYWVTLTDAQGCTATASVTIGQPEPIRIHTSSTPAKCFGENSGSAQALASAGHAPYSYLWTANGGVQQPGIQQLYAGVYIVSVTDAQGCRAADSVEVKQPDALSGSAQ